MLQRLHSANVRLQLSKCQFEVQKLSFLGHVISADGVQTDHEKVKPVQGARRPTSVSELRSFLGLTTYYGKFVPALSSVAYLLNRLLVKDTPWKWGKVEEAWNQLKQLLSSSTILCHYNPDLPLRLACDASSYGIAAVLSHLFPDGSERPLAYASKSLSVAEKGYSQLDKEALSIKFGVTYFHNFLYGRKFTLITDHKPLLSILGPYSGIPPLAAARMQRWALILAAYNYDLIFRPTMEHGNADSLSRLPLTTASSSTTFNEPFCHSIDIF